MGSRNFKGKNVAKTQQKIDVWMLFSAPENATFFVVFMRVNAESVSVFSVLAIYRASGGEWEANGPKNRMRTRRFKVDTMGVVRSGAV